jgi:glycosyltransferase involved in cell wall biosynthesis
MLDLEKADCSMLPAGEHHAKARSGRVDHSKQSPQPELERLRPKIGRYLQRWQTRFEDQLATSRYWGKADEQAPGMMEVLADQMRYHTSQFLHEQFTPFVYGVVPTSWLKMYRQMREVLFPVRDRRENVAGKTAPLPGQLKISVITPSYKQLTWIKLCAASVADQTGVNVEHIIQDAESGPELEGWVKANTKASLYIERDSGMYDAINRGFARATGDVLCWLNSDEQYIEGALARVAEYFETHPDIDVLFGDALLIEKDAKLVSYRRTILPSSLHVRLAHLNTLTCATFIRRSVFDRGFKLNDRWKTIADAVWIVSLLDAGVKMAVLNEPLAVFAVTEKNLGQTSTALAEARRWRDEMPATLRLLGTSVIVWHRIKKMFHGAYGHRSVDARFYTFDSPTQRVNQSSDSIGFHWPR